MEITEQTLAEAWQRTTAAHALLHGVELPPLALSEDELERCAELTESPEGDGLCLLLDGTGTVRGHRGRSPEVFATRELEQVLYLIAEAVPRRSAGSTEETAQALEQIDPAWGGRFRSGGLDDTGAVEACGRDPLEGFAWIAKSWCEQVPYTNLTFFRAAPGRSVDAERLALLCGADPAQVAAGTRLKDLEAVDGGRTHERDQKDGRRVDDGEAGVLELIWYERGQAPYRRGGELDFLNRALRRAEQDHPELTDPFELYFHALEESLGLRLPRRDFAEGEVRAAYWAGEGR
ncbi:hypothetical protein ACFW2Y_16780 [Streptomyces sp. NPDC058877]|uniref:hypothetical protein n=1 Tax=Streptomyces sp. NPDC058877 TaxID=3346665 RepID=UPI0036C44674